MKLTTGKQFAWAATALGTVLSAPALAQEVPAAGAGDIVVTARRVEERLQDVPISMTVYSQAQIADRNITVASDLATYTPSLSVNERYGPEKSSFSLRGFNQDQSTAPTVGVYFADVVGVRAQGGTTSGNTVGAGAFMDLQNVQVLKGPQGTLFGRNTTGGAILLVPHKPTDSLEGYAEGSVGNYDMRRFQGAINVPLADTFKVRVAADRMLRDGYMHNRSGVGPKDYNDRNYFAARLSIVADLTPDLENYTIFHYSHSQTNGFGARLVACDRAATPGSSPTSPTRPLTAMAACEQIDRQAARGDGLRDVDIGVDDPFLDLEQWQVINTTTWRASDTLTIKNIMSYGEFRERAHFSLNSDNFFGPAGGYPLGTVNPLLGGLTLPAGTPFEYITLDTPPSQDNAAQSTMTEELQVQGNSADGKLTYVIGGYLEFSRPLGFNGGRTGIFLDCDRPQDLTCANPGRIGTISESSTKFNFDNHGVFAQGTYKFTDQLALTVGARYTFDKIKAFSQSTRASLATAATPGAFPDPATGVLITRRCTDSFRYGNILVQDQASCRTDLRNSSNKPTWLINLDYKPNEDLMVYAKWARGYRQGGINFTNPGVETWAPESIDAYEIGAKASFRGAVSGYFNVAAFYNNLRDMQVFAGLTSGDPSVAGGAAIINAGKARSQGLEVDSSLLFFDSLRLTVGYTYLDTKIQNVATTAELLPLLVGTPFVDIRPTVSPGSPFTLAPKHKLTLSGEYTLPLDESLGKLSVGATMIYNSRQVANGSILAPTDPNSPISLSPVGVFPGKTLLNLNLNWSDIGGMPVDLAVFATNVTNKEYPVNIGGGFNSAGFETVLVGEPRVYGLRLRYKFGQ